MKRVHRIVIATDTYTFGSEEEKQVFIERLKEGEIFREVAPLTVETDEVLIEVSMDGGIPDFNIIPGN